MARFAFISEKNRERYLKIITPIGDFFARMGVHPNILSVLGLILSMAAGFIYSTGAFFWAAWVVLLAGILDTLDGHIARRMRKASPFGAYLDSTLDRYGEMFLFIGLACYFAGGVGPGPITGAGTGGHSSPLTVLVIILAMTGSFMVSYAKARAEGLGVECKVGLMQRPERITLLIIGSLLGSIPAVGPVLLKFTLLLMALSTNFTAIHRMVHVRSLFLKENKDK
jgi:CDP-diacylglycerol--glycerol-3-phosphate 3-phosphatidyltransferase